MRNKATIDILVNGTKIFYRRYLRRAKDIIICIPTGKFNFGKCPVCERRTIFLKTGPWLRDQYICALCGSIPRQRAIIRVLETLFPEYRKMSMHESSPGRPSSKKLQRVCENYTSAHYFQDVPQGECKGDVRCENLEEMTFDDDSFDLIITQDVLEHVLNPEKAFAEISRILKPGGAHVFTVPYYYWQETIVRAVDTLQGIAFKKEKLYHGNPIDKNGSLVVTEWGEDLVDYIYLNSGMTTTIYDIRDLKMGLDAKFLEVFVSRKKKYTES
jgi:SAM-dependent methyltransferase